MKAITRRMAKAIKKSLMVCPHCGKIDKIDRLRRGMVGCKRCSAYVICEDDEKAVCTWNMRAEYILPEHREMVERGENMYKTGMALIKRTDVKVAYQDGYDAGYAYGIIRGRAEADVHFGAINHNESAWQAFVKRN